MVIAARHRRNRAPGSARGRGYSAGLAGRPSETTPTLRTRPFPTRIASSFASRVGRLVRAVEDG